MRSAGGQLMIVMAHQLAVLVPTLVAFAAGYGLRAAIYARAAKLQRKD